MAFRRRSRGRRGRKGRGRRLGKYRVARGGIRL